MASHAPTIAPTPKLALLLLAVTIALAGVVAPSTSHAATVRTAHLDSDGQFVVTTASMSLNENAALMLKLEMAQFHHLRAMHGIGWALVGLLTAPNLAVIGGGVLIAGFISGLFGADESVLIAGVILVVIAGALLVAGIPTLIGNLIQAVATSAQVEALRARILNGLNDSSAMDVRQPDAGFQMTLAW